MIKFNATKLAAVAIAQSTEKTRYYLCGVYFTGARAVATDGHMLTVARDADSMISEAGIYPISKKAVTAMKKGETVTIDNNLLTVLDDQEQVVHLEPCKEIDGTFPEYQRIIPAGDDYKQYSAPMTSLVMERLVKTSKTLSKSQPITIFGRDDTDPMVVRYNGQDDVFSVAMPVRTTKIDTPTPNWV